MNKNKYRIFGVGLFILLTGCLILIVALFQTNFQIRSGIELDENSYVSLDAQDYYQGFSIETKGFVKPNIDKITIIKKNGDIFVDSERILIDIYGHTGSTSIKELNENRVHYTNPENYIPANKEFNLVVKNDSLLRLYENRGIKNLL